MSDAKSPQDLPMGEILATIRRIIAEDEQAGPSVALGTAAPPAGAPIEPAAAAPQKPAAEEVLELTAAVTEDGSVRQLAPLGGSTHHIADESREPAAPASVVAAPETQPEPRLTIPPEPAAGAAGEPAEPLLSETATAAAVASLTGLAAAPREPAPLREAVMLGERPLEASVRELLRPLLRSWLDQNLPEIVERLVKAEIARLSRRTGGE